jgi:hypothetical protein
MEKEEALFSLMNLEFGNVFLGLESICPEPGDVYLAPSPLCVCPAMMILNFTFQLRRFQCRRRSVRKVTKKEIFHFELKNFWRISCGELKGVWVPISSVSDPIWIRIQIGQCIRIRNPDPDLGGRK